MNISMIERLRIPISAVLLALTLTTTAFAQASPVSKQVEIYGQKIHYLEAGSSGPTVILLHGLGDDATTWARNIPALALKYHVYAPDQIGFGQSDKPLINYRVATLVEFLNQFYQKLGIEKAALVGNSFGGWAAAAFAIAHPQKVDKLALVSAAGYSGKGYSRGDRLKELYSVFNPSTAADMKRLFELIFYDDAIASDASVVPYFAKKLKTGDGYTINAFMDSILRGNEFIDDKVKAIKAPTLVIWGREDELNPLAMAEAFARDISGAQKVIIEQCGHVPQIEKAPAFNGALLKFLAGEPAPQH
jgi:2-hydroxy-6-oxonona-2,4-dienedioate hydrolase